MVFGHEEVFSRQILLNCRQLQDCTPILAANVDIPLKQNMYRPAVSPPLQAFVVAASLGIALQIICSLSKKFAPPISHGIGIALDRVGHYAKAYRYHPKYFEIEL